MTATIQYLDGKDGRIVELGDEPILVGRNAECVVRVVDDTITRRHARIYRENGHYWITDLNSDNGTYVNGSRLNAPQSLRHRDKIQCGRIRFEYFEK